ncbi:recombinase family protein [Sporanaerobium hydrogeniformans]|uniref:recombinase family protein n=1 Tax=Sporanaerobium hydrogeniformans TaxID=3072179 RepID=UPI0015D4BF8C|nr:recombinase family protein [Sporanaerobium hydrogeniformans]
MLRKVVGYIRVSTQMQVEEGFSIEGQKQQILEYAKKHNMEVVGFYVDEGISGKSIEGRHALKKLLDDTKKGCFQEVITWKVSRVARDVNDLLYFIKELNNEDIVLRSISENISTESVNSTFLVQMMGAVAELERKVITENVKLGINQKLREGWYKGAPVLGYDIVPKKLCKENHIETNLQVNKEEAEVVKLIFNLYEQGKGYKAIVNVLNTNNIKTKTGKNFSIGSINKILNRRLYTGEIEHKINGKIEIVQGKHEPIITMEQWQETRKDTLREHKKRESRIFTLSKLLKCPQCKSTMVGGSSVGRRGKKYYYYLCEDHLNKGKAVCKANSVPADRIEEEVYRELGRLINQPQIVEEVYRKINTYNADYRQKMKMLNEFASKKEVLEKRKRLLMKQFELDKLSKETFIVSINEIKEQLVTMEQTEKELQQYLSDNAKAIIPLEDIKEVFQNLIELLKKQEPKQIKQLLVYIINEIVVDEKKYLKHIEFKIKGQKFYLDAKEEMEDVRQAR